MATTPPTERSENQADAATRQTGNRILIVRLSAMGDLIHGIPVLGALRQALPEAFLGWVAEGSNADLLEGHPALDRLIRVPRGWLKSPQAVWSLRKELRQQRFDTTIDLQCLSKSAIAARLSGAPRRIGYAGKLGREISRWLNNELIDVNQQHVIDRYLGILQPLGIVDPEVRFDLSEQPHDRQFALGALDRLGLSPAQFAIVNPGAGWKSKLWPAERYGELAQQLSAQHGLPSLAVWGPAEEMSLAEQIVAHSGGAAQLAPATSMAQLASLSRRARLFIGSDTGPLHLAVAVGTPSISLHGTSLAAETGAYGQQHRSIQAWYDNSPGKRRQADNAAMRSISVQTVLTACAELLAVERSSEEHAA